MKIYAKLMLLGLISILIIPLTMASESNNSGNVTIIKEIPIKADLDKFIDTLPKSDNFTGIATDKAIELHPTWPHDIWIDSNGEYYISFYYKVKDTGYQSVYYDTYGNKLEKVCGIEFTLVAPYYGLNVTNSCDVNDTNVTDNMSNSSSSTSPTQVIQNNTIDNSTVVQVSGNNSDSTNDVNNSKGVINIQGNGNVVKQTFLDRVMFELSNIKDSVINIHF